MCPGRATKFAERRLRRRSAAHPVCAMLLGRLGTDGQRVCAGRHPLS